VKFVSSLYPPRMKRLSNPDWSLMARCITGEASPQELEQLQALYKQHTGLESGIDQIREDLRQNSPDAVTDFDADAAFAKLHKRIQDENLL